MKSISNNNFILTKKSLYFKMIYICIRALTQLTGPQLIQVYIEMHIGQN